MVQWEVTDTGIRVVDQTIPDRLVGSPDWETIDHRSTPACPVETALSGRTTRLTLPGKFVSITDLNTCSYSKWSVAADPIEFVSSKYLVCLDGQIEICIQFDGEATLRADRKRRRSILTFPTQRRVIVGFTTHERYPTDSVTITPTVSGFATALSYLHSALKTDGPDRSFPMCRGHPPAIEFGKTTEIPEQVKAATTDTDVTLELPNELSTLLVCAPLAYYLQARVIVSTRTKPLLRGSTADLSYEFPGLPELQTTVAALLRKIFFLDCLVRTAGPYGSPLAERVHLDTLGIDANALYSEQSAKRLGMYLGISTDSLEKFLPDWHLTTYVKSDPKCARSLPFLLDKLSLVALPSTTSLDGRELVKRSLDEFYRSKSVASVPIVKPRLSCGQVHAWIADGIPIDVFKTSYQAFENQSKYLDRPVDEIQIEVVLNDQMMAGEHDAIERLYNKRSDQLPLSIDIHEDVNCDELASIFERKTDLVHFIGHCEVDGLKCPDGILSTSSIDECSAQTFFLNACGSYHEGMNLIERGSVVGAITFSPVLDEQAATVGSTFARLLVDGFCFERAIGLARRRIMMGKDYAVVGDGTHTLSSRHQTHPAIMNVTQRTDGRYDVLLDTVCGWTNGGVYQPQVKPNDGPCLVGSTPTYTLTQSELTNTLDQTNDPVIFDGEFYWPEELQLQSRADK